MRNLAIAVVLAGALQASAAVVQPIGTHYQLLIPAAGSVAGANGTNFRSDIALLNLSPRTQVVRLEWLSQNGTTNATRYLTLNASSGVRSANFVADYLITSGLGSIVITAMTAETGGTVDPSGELFAQARIWTPQPGTAGTTSQSFPVIPVTTIDTPSAALFTVGGGPAPDDPTRYRVNVGVVNLAATAQTFTLSFPGTSMAPLTINVAARAMVQVPVGESLASSTQVNVRNTTDAATRSNAWVTYQSTVNNVTGDAWSELGVAGR